MTLTALETPPAAAPVAVAPTPLLPPVPPVAPVGRPKVTVKFVSRRTWLIAAAGAGGLAPVLLVVILVAALARSDGAGTARPTTEGGMVDIPAGTLYKGSWDDSTTLQLVCRYGLSGNTALKELLALTPRTADL